MKHVSLIMGRKRIHAIIIVGESLLKQNTRMMEMIVERPGIMRYAGADTQVVHSVLANRLVGDRKKDKTDLPFGQVRMHYQCRKQTYIDCWEPWNW